MSYGTTAEYRKWWKTILDARKFDKDGKLIESDEPKGFKQP